MNLPDSARALIESGAHAHLVTLNSDGSPQVTLVWAGVDGDDIVTAHLFASRKVRNIQQEGRVAVTFESSSRSEMGLVEYLVIYGHAASRKAARQNCCSGWLTSTWAQTSSSRPWTTRPLAT